MIRTILMAGAAVAAFSTACADTLLLFDYKPGQTTLIIPATGKYHILVYGADGGSAGPPATPAYGGAGGYANTSFHLSKGDGLNISVGAYNGPGQNAGVTHVSDSQGDFIFAYGGKAGQFNGVSGSPGAGGGYKFGGPGLLSGVGLAGFDGGGAGLDGAVEVDEVSPSAPAPEPSTWSLMMGGFGLLGYALRRRILRTA